MRLSMNDLDGKYRVESQTTSGGFFVIGSQDDFVPNGDGTTEIQNGQTFRKDQNGFIWESAFTLLEDGNVQMETTLDPSHADQFVVDAKGNLTKGMTNYKTILKPSVKNGAIVLQGDIKHAGETTRIVMTKL